VESPIFSPQNPTLFPTPLPSLAPFEFTPIGPAPKSEVISEAAIIGISAASGGCLLLLAGAIFYYNRRTTKDNDDTAHSNGKSHCDTTYTNTSP
jgi:hypothetical protein